jgi:hypothetical protein
MCFHKLYPSRFIENASLGLKCVIKAIKNGTTFANIKYKRFPCELGKVWEVLSNTKKEKKTFVCFMFPI